MTDNNYEEILIQTRKLYILNFGRKLSDQIVSDIKNRYKTSVEELHIKVDINLKKNIYIFLITVGLKRSDLSRLCIYNQVIGVNLEFQRQGLGFVYFFGNIAEYYLQVYPFFFLAGKQDAFRYVDFSYY